jgi:2-oxoglutarate dehydrogenase E2 component (dihydrolipoamide succinyltransferase)
MGESIAEGTIVRWIKKVGDTVGIDEPLFEISTDKVDAEIPAPAAGVLTEIKVKEGETVAVDSVVATIGQASELPTPNSRLRQGSGEAGRRAFGAEAARLPSPEPRAQSPEPRVQRPAPRVQSPAPRAESPEPGPRTSPFVRRIAREHDIDVTRIRGSGLGGRVTKHDILDYVEKQGAGLRAQASGDGDSGSRVEIKPLSAMRKKIAEHMVMSRRTSAHVHSVFHVDFSTVERIRRERKADYERLNTKLTYMAFIAKAVVTALRRFPIVNASLDGDNILYKKDINLGIAVALEGGLIVPVIRSADEKNLLGLSRAIADIAERARAKQLKPEEVHDGTFTITNPGQFGSQFGMPIINQPQVAILGVGAIERRPVVVDDAIAIRTMGYLTLGYDHRLIDGATGDQFMAEVKQQLERFDPGQV